MIEISTRINPISYEKPYLKRIVIAFYCVSMAFYFLNLVCLSVRRVFKQKVFRCYPLLNNIYVNEKCIKKGFNRLITTYKILIISIVIELIIKMCNFYLM